MQPYQKLRALTSAEIRDILNRPDRLLELNCEEPIPEWLVRWASWKRECVKWQHENKDEHTSIA